MAEQERELERLSLAERELGQPSSAEQMRELRRPSSAEQGLQ